MERRADIFVIIVEFKNQFQPYRNTASGNNMENILEKTVKANGNIELNELSWKQLIALMNIWNTDYAKKENKSFSEMVKRCYKSRPWHENANIIYLHKNNMKTTLVPHACKDLREDEEALIFQLLKKNLSEWKSPT